MANSDVSNLAITVYVDVALSWVQPTNPGQDHGAYIRIETVMSTQEGYEQIWDDYDWGASLYRTGMEMLQAPAGFKLEVGRAYRIDVNSKKIKSRDIEFPPMEQGKSNEKKRDE
jgi:hypothetical protein